MIRDFLRWLDNLKPRDQWVFLAVYTTCCFTLTIAFTSIGKMFQ